MARIPVYRPQQGISPGRAPSINVDTSGAVQVARFGGAVQDFGQGLADDRRIQEEKASRELRAEQERQEDATASVWLSKERAGLAVRWQAREAELAQSADAASPDFTARLRREWEADQAAVLARAPNERARLMFQTWAPGFGGGLEQRSVETARQAVEARRVADFGETMNAHVLIVASDPGQYDRVLTRAMDDLELARSWMTPEQETAARQQIKRQLQNARADHEARFNPAGLLERAGLGSDAVSQAVSKIIGVESSGNPNAKNPKSSASGLGQFTDDTWLATIKAHRPDLAALPREQQLALKTDPALGREMTSAHTQDNAKALQAAGMPVTEGTLYLAHFAGVDGAKRVLRAGDDTPVVQVLGPRAVAANDFLQGKSIGWLKQWADKKMGSATPSIALTDPMFKGMTPDEAWGYIDQAQQVINAQARDAAAQQTAQIAAIKGSMQLAIATGEPIGRNDILSLPIPDDDKAVLVNSLKERDKNTVTAAAFLGRMADPAVEFDAFSETERKGLNLAYEAEGGAAGLRGGDLAAVERAGRYVERTGVLPAAAVADLRRGIYAANPQEMDAALSVADQLYRRNPEAVGRALGETERERLEDWQALRPYRTAEEVYETLKKSTDPAEGAAREKRRIEGKKLAVDIDNATVIDLFDPGMFSSGPDAPIEPVTMMRLRSDFDRNFADLYARHGNVETAKMQAAERLKAVWGGSGANGGRLMRYPPEKYYPPVGGSQDWMREQLVGAIKETGAAYQDFALVSTPETASRPGSGYMVVLQTDSGLDVLRDKDGRPLRWRFDPDAAREKRRTEFEAERARERTPDALDPVARDMMGVGDLSAPPPAPLEAPTPPPAPSAPAPLSQSQSGQSWEDRAAAAVRNGQTPPGPSVGDVLGNIFSGG